MKLNIQLADGSSEPVEVRRRRQRRVILHFDAETESFWVSAPHHVSQEYLLRFLAGPGARWILKQREAAGRTVREPGIPYRGVRWPLVYSKGEPQVRFADGVFQVSGPSYEDARRAFEAWWEADALRRFGQMAERWLSRLGSLIPEPPVIRIRPLKRSWGICYPYKGKIHFASKLLAVPDSLIDYIVLHELAHLLQPGHGAGFRAFMDGWMPDWEERRRTINGEAGRVSPVWPPDPPES